MSVKMMNDKMKLNIGADQYIILERISSDMYQVNETHRCEYIGKSGDMVRFSTRGYEFFTTPEAATPRYVLPVSVVLSAYSLSSDEEE